MRTLDKSISAIGPLPRHRRNGNNVGDLPSIIDLSEVVISPSEVPSKVH